MKLERRTAYYLNDETGEIFTYAKMVEYCKENYDYGDETNYITYMEHWYEEYGFIALA